MFGDFLQISLIPPRHCKTHSNVAIPPLPSPGEKVAERKRGRKWNAGRDVGRGRCLDFLKCRSGISLSIFRPLGDHPHSTSVICSFFANASLRSSERPVGGSDSPPGCHSLPPTALRLPREKLLAASRTDCPEASPYIGLGNPPSFRVIARSEATWQSVPKAPCIRKTAAQLALHRRGIWD